MKPKAVSTSLLPARGFSRARASAERGELRIYDVIGADWFGGIAAKEIGDALDSMKDVAVLDVYINSPGGDVFEGLAIYNQLKRFAGRKVVHIDGLAASAASLIAMAGDEIRMPKTSMMMVHNAWIIAMGNSSELRKVADDLDQISIALRAGYCAKSGMKDDECKALLDQGDTWLTADQAKEKKLCDVVEEPDEDDDEEKAAARAAHPLLAKFKSVPEKLAAKSNASDVKLATMKKRVQQLANRRVTKPAK